MFRLYLTLEMSLFISSNRQSPLERTTVILSVRRGSGFAQTDQNQSRHGDTERPTIHPQSNMIAVVLDSKVK